MEPEKKKPTEKHRNALLVYVSVLFAVAFLLILLSFLIQLRNSNETISQLSQSSANAISNVQTLQTYNQTLQEENDSLTKELEALQDELDAVQAELADAQEELAAAQANLEAQQADYDDLKAETDLLANDVESETARADAAEVKVATLTDKARAYEQLLQAENYFRNGYYTSASQTLESMEAENLPTLLDEQGTILYSSLPNRIYIAQMPSTDSAD